jgi:cyclohexyl-isocyanide hydratase
MVSLLRGETVAMELQLYMNYDPEPPFNAGSPDKAPLDVLRTVTKRAQEITDKRLATGRAYQAANTVAA